jgi:hypothetical protein
MNQALYAHMNNKRKMKKKKKIGIYFQKKKKKKNNCISQLLSHKKLLRTQQHEMVNFPLHSHCSAVAVVVLLQSANCRSVEDALLHVSLTHLCPTDP